MDLTQEVIESAKLTPEQVTAVKAFGENYVADIKKEYDTKSLTNAEGILEGAVKTVQSKTGINEPRQQGEKYADYLVRISDKFLTSKSTALDAAKADYDAKIKDFKGGDLLKVDLDKAKADYDSVLKKYADYEDIKGKADKFDSLDQEHSKLKLGMAFSNVKPSFPDTVNPYEAKAKWDEFIASVLEKNTIEIVDGIAIAVDKENKYKSTKLKELVDSNEVIKTLVAGRQQQGSGARAQSNKMIEGVPFEVPENAKETSVRSQLIRKHLAKQGILVTAPNYSAEFAKLNKQIVEGLAKA